MDVDNPFTWEDSYSIALALRQRYPNVSLEEVSLGMIFQWVTELADFDDDPQLANDDILMAIYQEWYEEVNPI